MYWILEIHSLAASESDNLCKQFVPRSGPTKCRAYSGFKLFESLVVFMKNLFEKKIILKTNSVCKIPSMQRAIQNSYAIIKYIEQ